MRSDFPQASRPPIRIGVSACLLGERVRYDADHKRDPVVAEILASLFELIPVCPEVGIGLGIPRPPIRLEGDPARPRAVGVADRTRDVTEALAAYGRAQAAELAGISGYVFKSKSPSCGLKRVKVHAGDDPPREVGRGIYARELTDALPTLPVAEEGDLRDPAARARFIERVYAYHRRRQRAAGAANERKEL